jgi:hypothetical protein
MIPQTQAKIFLSGERGLNEQNGFRSYNTFSSYPNQNIHKESFGSLYLLNDITLAGNKKIILQVEENSNIILLPVVGAITCRDSNGKDTLIEPGQIQIYTVPENSTIEIRNPYKLELVNFLQIRIRHPLTNLKAETQVFSFDLEHNRNKLVELYPNAQKACNKTCIGKFAGREEGIYQMEDKGLFVFVIEGAFEVQYRLLEARDGLALWNVKEVEFEALSNDAIVLLLELPFLTEPCLQA